MISASNAQSAAGMQRCCNAV